jgi:hypothetical protein
MTKLQCNWYASQRPPGIDQDIFVDKLKNPLISHSSNDANVLVKLGGGSRLQNRAPEIEKLATMSKIQGKVFKVGWTTCPENKKGHVFTWPFNSGSPTWTRTRDLRINSPSLYQLSYQGKEALL